MSSNHGPGCAPEIAQARVREQIALSGEETVLTPVGGSDEQAGGAPPAPEANPAGQDKQVDADDKPANPIDLDLATKTGRLPLATLPDTDLWVLCKQNNIDCTGFKDRQQAVDALPRGVSTAFPTRLFD